ncbi:hypothetical protein BDV12DRAFT_190915 [Aspergillus spectabilis]
MTVAVDDSPKWHQMQVDANQLAAKYKEEREKRTKKEGMHQYQHAVTSTLQPMTDDPFVAPGFQRKPVSKTVEIAVIGGGVGGLIAAAHLVKAGFDDIVIVEKGGDFGGVWYWNRYPGIQIDIESYIYMPLLEDVGYMPTKKYAFGGEIRTYLQSLAKHFDLYSKVIFQTQVTEMRWDAGTTSWKIATTRDDEITAKWLVPATGPFDNPKFPGIPGIESFKGHQFHTSRWDYDYTGGNSEGSLTKLADKRIGIIGTGATGIQVIPHLGEWSKELYVFQRTPSTIDERRNRPTDENWYKSQAPGWQRKRMRNFADICSGVSVDKDLVADGWTDTLSSLTGFFGQGGGQDTKAINGDESSKILQLADFKKTEQIRQRVDRVVKDPSVAAALKPYYNLFCKRPCFHDDYLLTFNRPNVTLVDTDGKGIDCITESGIVANGKSYELDCIIYATGFEYNSDWKLRHHAEIYGVNGLSLSDKWKEGPVTFHGWSVNGFPNCFFVSSAQTAALANYGHSLVAQAQHLVYLLSKVKADNIKLLEAKEEAEDEWIREVIRASKERAVYLQQCTPGYYNDEGQVSDKTAKNNPFAATGNKFFDIVGGWRKDDKLEGMEVLYHS